MVKSTMRKTVILVVVLLMSGAGVGLHWVRGQSPLAGRRVMAKVPMVGKGTDRDPARPMFTETPWERDQRLETAREAAAGKGAGGEKERAQAVRAAEEEAEPLSFRYVLSDDGRFALVEFVAYRPGSYAWKVLDALEGSKDAEVSTFSGEKNGKWDVEKEFKKYKKDFTLDEFVGFRRAGGAK